LILFVHFSIITIFSVDIISVMYHFRDTGIPLGFVMLRIIIIFVIKIVATAISIQILLLKIRILTTLEILICF